jgi:rare lipoprotein A
MVAGALTLAQCSSGKLSSRIDPRYGVSASERVIADGEPVPKGGGVYRVGKPYMVAGQIYVPEEDTHYRAEGIASWYGSDFHGRLTANGEIYDMNGISAAHPTLPIPCYARVTNLNNGRSIVVRVNDRGPYHSNRLIDLSQKTAQLLDFHGHGLARVRVEYVGRAPLEGEDDRVLVATLRENGPAPAPSAVRIASAKPFVPQLATRRVSDASVPTPSDRPYELGTPEPDARTAIENLPGGRTRTAQVSSQVSSQVGNTQVGTQANAPPNGRVLQWQTGPSPAPAYMSVRDEGGRNLLTGRGLY